MHSSNPVSLTWHFQLVVVVVTTMAQGCLSEGHALLVGCWSGDASAVQSELELRPSLLNARVDCPHNPARNSLSVVFMLSALAVVLGGLVSLIVLVVVPGSTIIRAMLGLFVLPTMSVWSIILSVITGIAVYERVRSHAGTPLHHAVRSKRIDVVRVILSMHPDLTAVDASQRTSHAIAKQQGFTEICALIEAERASQGCPPVYSWQHDLEPAQAAALIDSPPCDLPPLVRSSTARVLPDDSLLSLIL